MADFSRRPGSRRVLDGSWSPVPHHTVGPGGPPSAGRGAVRAPWGLEREFRVGRVLRDALRDGELIFSDRRLAGAVATTDHVVVATSGVWVIDAKRWKAVSFRVTDDRGSVERLYAGGHDVTVLVDGLCDCLSRVAAVVRDPSVPLRPAMAILTEQCRFVAGLRFRLGKPIWHGDVLIGPPGVLVEQIRRSGPLTRDQVLHIGHRVDEALLPG